MSKLNAPRAGIKAAKTGTTQLSDAALQMAKPVTRTATQSVDDMPSVLSPESREYQRFLRQRDLGYQSANYVKPAKPWDVAHEIFMSGTLGNFRTPWLNQISNTVNAIMAPMDTASKAFLTMFSSKEKRVQASEVAAHIYGIFEGFAQTLSFTAQRLKNLPRGTETRADTLAKMRISQGLLNTDKLEQRQRVITAENLGLDPTTAMGKAISGIGAIINVPVGILNYQDLMFKMVNQGGTVRAWAQRQVNQGVFSNMDEAMEAAARDPKLAKQIVHDAEYYTYMNRPKMPMLSWVTDASVEKLPGMRWIIPFRRTIANVLEQGIERSPLVLASPTLRQRLFHPNFDIRLDAQAKLLTGLTTMTALAAMLDNSEGWMLVGQGPKDSFNKASWENLYGPEESLIFRGGPKENHWSIKLDDLGPFGLVLKAAANYKQWLAGMPQERLDAAIGTKDYKAIMEETGKFILPVFEAGYTNWWGRDLSEFFQAIELSRKNEGNIKPVARWAEQIASRLVPVLGTGYNRTLVEHQDPIAREYRESGDYFMMLTADTSKLLRPRYDNFGREVVRNSFKKPGHEFPENPYDPNDPISRELFDAGLDLRPVSDYIRAESTPIPGSGSPVSPREKKRDGPKVDMTDEEYATVQKWKREGFAGLLPYRKYMEISMKMPAVANASKPIRHSTLAAVHEDYNHQLLELAAETLPDLRMRLEQAKVETQLDTYQNLFMREAAQ